MDKLLPKLRVMLHPPDDFDVMTKLVLNGRKVNKNLVYWQAKDASSNDLQQIDRV